MPGKNEAVSVDGKLANSPETSQDGTALAQIPALAWPIHTVNTVSAPEMMGFRSAANQAHRLKYKPDSQCINLPQFHIFNLTVALLERYW